MLTLEPSTFDVELNTANVLPSSVMVNVIRKVYTKELAGEEGEGLRSVLIIVGMTQSFRTNGDLVHTYAGVRYQGSLVKRIAKLCHKFGLPKLDTKELGMLGQQLGEQTSMTLYMEIAKFSDWRHGAFEESVTKDIGSCWWNKHNSARIGLVEDPNGYSVLLYESDESRTKYKRVKGIGRCWLYRFDNGVVIFNAYGTYSLTQIAYALAKHLNKTTNRIRVTSTAYINAGIMNNEGRGGGYEGIGYWIGDGEPMSITLPDFRHKEQCVVCEERIPEDDGKYFSERDANNNINNFYCLPCMGPLNNCDFCGNRYRIRGKGSNANHCANCIRNYTITCAVHGDVVSKPVKEWHGDTYCDRCARNGVVRRCAGCKRTVHVNRTSKEILKVTGDYRCIPCTKKIARELIKEVGDPR